MMSNGSNRLARGAKSALHATGGLVAAAVTVPTGVVALAANTTGKMLSTLKTPEDGIHLGVRDGLGSVGRGIQNVGSIATAATSAAVSASVQSFGKVAPSFAGVEQTEEEIARVNEAEFSANQWAEYLTNC